MKFLARLALMGLLAIVPLRAQTFVAQVANGLGDGSSCVDAKLLSSLAWTTGMTVNLCGQFVGAPGQQLIRVGASGVTIKFAPGAVLTAPYWSASGAINAQGRSDVVIDGGGSGVIQNTANGTGLLFHNSSIALLLDGCTNCTVQNLTVQNMYVRTSVSDLALNSAGNVACVRYNSTNGITINHVICHDAGWAFEGSGNDTMIAFSEAYNIDHGVAAGASGTYTNFTVHDSYFHDFAAWDSGAPNLYHHDGIHVWGNGANAVGVPNIWVGVSIYNNAFDGDQGASNVTAFIFLQNQISNATIDHNRFHVKLGRAGIIPIEIGNVNMPTPAQNDVVDHNLIVFENSPSLYKVQGSAVSFTNILGVTFTNNVVFGGVWNVGFSGTTTLASVDSNVYEDVLHDFGSLNAWGFQGHSYHDLATWRGVCGCDAHSSLIAFRK